MLKVDNINFSYGEVPILANVSIEVGDGMFVLIIGPNGHGKSTLLKTICGLQNPQSGSIIYNNREIDNLPVQKIVEMGLVYIAEDRHLFPDMSVIDNLMMGAYNKNARLKEKENLDFVLDLFPKLKLLKKNVASSLSGGEARMLAIGRGLMSNPEFLAIDEPSLGLAPNLRVEVFKKIDDIKQKGASILLVEQSTAIAAEYADIIYVLEDGKIVFSGTREEAFDNQNIREVFLGT
jgi:branched-chain amino acid transport system ATP-binding protein